jgi:purine-binding chemotaxis protein CheW
VVEVLYLLEPTPVPGWPPHALGLIDVRGMLIPLLEVTMTLGLPPRPLSPSQYILLIEAFEKPFGLVVDTVEGVRTLQLSDESSIPSHDFLGVPIACAGTVEADGRVIVLEPDALIGALRIPARDADTAPRGSG